METKPNRLEERWLRTWEKNHKCKDKKFIRSERGEGGIGMSYATTCMVCKREHRVADVGSW